MTIPKSSPALAAISLLLALAARAQSPSPPADLAQLMKGIVYPSANVFFVAQSEDPAAIKPDLKPSISPNLLTSVFGKWEAVENSALAMAESASLLSIAGRKCSNGVEVPVKSPDWEKMVAGLREAAMIAFRAAQSKNQDNILSAAEAVTTACARCHGRYRERANRCR